MGQAILSNAKVPCGAHLLARVREAGGGVACAVQGAASQTKSGYW
jgi:hypothetical protein